ncbi:hypothetical protein E3N88_14941 [Mikania micrantha]|uniref:DUF659 domain-containing protein n=1 Tax=Mikania micrantha TaxID=192012 RepID=A0A5N6P4L5_9ASTR|nr:hypothetical protein E3N88_14941 [Mikania micrantha]
MKWLEVVYKEKKAGSKEKEVELPRESGIGFKKRKDLSEPLQRDFGVEIRDQLDQEIAKMFYTRDLPFNLARNPHYAVHCFREVKDRFFIAELMKKVINEIGHQNVVQIITDNAANFKAAGEIIKSQFPHIYWTSSVMHTHNLALKNVCSPRNVETNETTYEECK